MDRREQHATPKLEVAAAKARLRAAAQQVQPVRDLSRGFRSSPWASVGAALALGLLLGTVPRTLGSKRGLVATLLRRLV